MAQNQTADWFPTPTGNTQYDENQRRLWQSLYYLRDQHNNNATAPVAGHGTGMSVTMTFVDSNNNAISVVIGGKKFKSLTFANGLFVSSA